MATITLYDNINIIIFNKENSDEDRVCARVISEGEKDVGPILKQNLFISSTAATLIIILPSTSSSNQHL